MIVENNKVVTITYKASSGEGKVLESSDYSGNLDYIHGQGFLVPGMEKALDGKKAGDKVDELLEASEAFGIYDEAMIFGINRADFTVSDDELKVGLEFQAEIKGDVRFCRVDKIEEDKVIINANHPYAGMDIRFEAEILGIRDPSPEELDHGHVHASGAHSGHSCGCGNGKEDGCAEGGHGHGSCCGGEEGDEHGKAHGGGGSCCGHSG
ncbi:MAG: peptidylprolyl isomerase [Spirochaetia bacterium]|jgi:FKBP-type peptidyl-prolyl cis-trans isomerase SlyD|nr:peptidylprolyl isomerase [Spirochaetia bacterium]